MDAAIRPQQWEFVNDLAPRLKHRVQITTDGHRRYLEAIESAFGSQVDYSMLIKLYGGSQDETRYSPAECIGTRKDRIVGNPDPMHVSTSYVERQNLTMRMGIKIHKVDERALQKDRESYPRNQLALHTL